MMATVLLVLAMSTEGDVIYKINRVADMQTCRESIAEAKEAGKFPASAQFFCLQVPEET